MVDGPGVEAEVAALPLQTSAMYCSCGMQALPKLLPCSVQDIQTRSLGICGRILLKTRKLTNAT